MREREETFLEQSKSERRNDLASYDAKKVGSASSVSGGETTNCGTYTAKGAPLSSYDSFHIGYWGEQNQSRAGMHEDRINRA